MVARAVTRISLINTCGYVSGWSKSYVLAMGRSVKYGLMAA